MKVHTGIRAYAFDCSYDESTWLDDPSSLISDLQTALAARTNINSYAQLKIANVKNASGKKVEIEIVNITYKTKTQLSATENDDLITDLQTAFNTITDLVYGNVNIVNDVFREDPSLNWPDESMQKE